jgi:MFS family permease
MRQHPLSPAIGGLLFLTGLFFLNFTSRVIFSPLLPVIEQEMGIDHAQSGSFFLFISAGYFISILCSGFLSEKINHKRSIVLSCLTLGLALIILSRCMTLLSLQLGLFGLGLGAGLYFPSGLASISNLVAPAYLSRGMAIHELAPNLGFVAAPLLCEFFFLFLPWRQGLILLGVMAICSGIVYGLSSYGCREKGKAPDLSSSGALLRMPAFWGMFLLFSLAICSTLGIYAMAPLFLVNDHGMDLNRANNLLAFSRVTSIFMPLIGGWFGDRFGNQLVMGVVLLVTGILTIIMATISGGTGLVLFVVLQPLFAVCFFPSGFAVLTRLGAEKYGNLAVSLCLPLAFLVGGGLLPALIGWIGDQYSIGFGFVFVGLLMSSGGIGTFVVRKMVK